MADVRVKYVADAGPFSEVGITGKQTSWRKNYSAFVPAEDATLLIASGKFVLSSTAFGVPQDAASNHAAEHAAMTNLVKILPWAGFVPRILPSYVASTTVDQTGTTVTVTATAHGIPNIAVLTGGHEVYFPGSPSIAAGWYPGFSRASANTITFTYPISQTVVGESVNGGAAYTTATKFYELIIPGESLGVNGECTGRLMRHCGSTAATKLTEYKLAGATIMKSPLATTLGCGFLNNTFANVGSVSKQLGFSAHDQIGVANGGQMYGAVNMANDQILELYGTISAAADYLAVASACVMVKP